MESLKKDITVLDITLNSLSKEIEEIKDKVDVHDKYLIRGNGQPSMMDDIRTIKEFIKGVRFWLTTIAVILVGELATLTVGAVLTLIQLFPKLQEIVSK